METFHTFEAAAEQWLARQHPKSGQRPASRIALNDLVRSGEIMLRETGLTRPHEIATRLHGRVWFENGQRKLLAPWPTTNRAELYILAHEIGHWMLHGPGYCREDSDAIDTQYRREYEAELYAHEQLRKAGVSVPRELSRHAKVYVGHFLRLHLSESNVPPDPDIMAWAKFDLTAERAVVVGQEIARGLAKGDHLSGKIDLRLYIDNAPIPPEHPGWFVAVSKQGYAWGKEASDILRRSNAQRLPNDFTVEAQHVAQGIERATAAGLRIARG